MFKTLKILIMSCLIGGPAGVVAGQEIDPFYRLFPTDAFRSSILEDVFQEGVRTYTGITVHNDEMDIGMDKLSLRSIPSGDIVIEIGAMTVRPKDQAAPAVSLTGLSLQLRDWPKMKAEDSFCAWADVIRGGKVTAAEIRLPTEPAAVSSVRAQGIGFEARGLGGACWISGVTSLDSADIYRNDGSSFELTQLRADVSLPGSRTSAATAGKKSSLIAELAEIEARKAGGTPAFALSNVDISSALETDSLQGILHVLRTSTFFGTSAKPLLNSMQLTNAFTLVNGDFSADAPITRIYYAGVIPPEAMTNFSRVGLSTITGTSSFSAKVQSGALRLHAEASLIGLTDLEATIMGRLAPYSRPKLEAARDGMELGVHLIPDATISAARISYTDTGFEGYFRELTGVPSGRYIEEFGALLAEQQSGRVTKSIQKATRSISAFFRFAAEQKTMLLSISPKKPIRLVEISYLAITDLHALAAILELKMVQREDDLEH
ncbi:hypothetical protein KUV57_13175 [Epibacterium sp. DP7N7-1]|nr:hypothetical protein [Epibacterium sp. DP7N7-1]